MQANGGGQREVRVFIVDDHAPFLDTVSAVVGLTETFVVAGRAASGEEALRSLRRMEKVDLLLVDFGLPGIDGLQTIARYREGGGGAVSILLSTTDERDLPDSLIDYGVSAFIAKAAFSTMSLERAWQSLGTTCGEHRSTPVRESAKGGPLCERDIEA